jgi:hypothetical protein
MSATDKKRALRGQPAKAEPAPSMNLDDFETPDDLEEPDDLDREAQELDDEEDDEALEKLDDAPLPDNCEVEEDTGDWVYTLQYPLADGSKTPAKIRIPKVIYAKNVRDSSRGKTQAETVFYMLASCSKVPPRVLDKVNAVDYMVLASLMNRRALGNSRAVLSALAGKGR